MKYARRGVIIQLSNVKNTEFQYPDSKNDAVFMPVIKKTPKKKVKKPKKPHQKTKSPNPPNPPLSRTEFFADIIQFESVELLRQRICNLQIDIHCK